MANNKEEENNSQTTWILVLVGVLVVILVIFAIFYLSGNAKFKFMKQRVARPNAQGMPKIRKPKVPIYRRFSRQYDNPFNRTRPGIRYI